MDFLASLSPELLVGVGAALQLLFVKLSRRSGIESRYLVVGASVLVALGYVWYTKNVAVDVQAAVSAFTAEVFAVQWLVYEGYKKLSK